ncbi:hypothetical protein ONE63_001203 [Megalurothrips usitatus]|uniref:Uncharacterized protein n=1 Tax=Megalurothrips usitatus TaxID=439358 RepID=A0AAV7XI68_9NEOP|nr:hypothetical protein ONE63_001203 [Megalurothrips usitatus]
MGKVRRLRQKYHLACQKSGATDTDLTTTPVVPVFKSVPGQVEVPVKCSNDSNIFAGVTISVSDLNQTLLPPPKQATQVLGSVSEASVAGSSRAAKATKHIPKKEKRLARREMLLRKIDTVRKLKQESKQALKRRKKPTPLKPMLMQSLIEALPLFNSTKNSQTDHSGTAKKDGKIKRVKACPTKHKRKKDFLENLKSYKTVLSNSHYQADPASAISNYLLRTVSQTSVWDKTKK